MFFSGAPRTSIPLLQGVAENATRPALVADRIGCRECVGTEHLVRSGRSTPAPRGRRVTCPHLAHGQNIQFFDFLVQLLLAVFLLY